MISLIFLFILLILVLFHNFYWKRRKLPPGPTPWPLFGNSFDLDKKYSPGYGAFQKWSKEFGPVYTFWIGEIPIVAVTDYEVIKQTFIKDGDAYAGRDFLNAGFEALKDFSCGIHGVVRTQGDEWRHLRRFSTQVLKNLGMGKSTMETKILTEVKSLIDCVKKDISDGKKEHDIIPLIDVGVGSVITQMMFGYRFHEDSRSEFFRLKETMIDEVVMASGIFCKMVLVMPWLRHFPIFSTAFRKFDANIGEQFAFFDQQISNQIMKCAELKSKPGEQFPPPDNFVEAFLRQIDANNNEDMTGESKYFSIPALRNLCFELYGAGQETTSNTLNFVMLYMILNEDCQCKMQEELDRVIPEDRMILTTDKPKLPYTNAVIHECQRLCNLVPQNLPHRTTRDVEICGQRIEEGTRIVPQISSVLYDEKIFPQPHKFMPERFLDSDGQLKKCEELIPFSIGKRQCMGESLARMELFLFTANIFNKFHITMLDPASPPTAEKISGLTVRPKDYTCTIEERKKPIST
ncbi:cytochrome p450 domain-containing protein [Ditylenchus destructor]|nr:cytochrome p450 domain-containing protein [Ditylenchus destructor]